MYQIKFKNKYRIKSTRLKEFDYSSDGVYFITICTKNREYYFGEIVADTMKYTKIGAMAKKYWQQIPRHFPSVRLDEFIVMPNHVHGIIMINKNNTVETRHGNKNVNKNNNDWVETRHGASLRNGYYVNSRKLHHGASLQGNKFGKLKNNSLQSIINHYKGSVTHWANMNNIQFVWQPRYYDHIIRNEYELNRIRQYIIENPFKWEIDRNNF